MRIVTFHKRKIGKGQAAAEMAILGTLLILAFSVLLTYGQRLSGQQQTKMEAFRNALSTAFKKNSSVSYSFRKDVRFHNAMGGFGEGQGSSLSASASVMWQKGMAGEQNTVNLTAFAFNNINNNEIEMERVKKRIIGYDGSQSDVWVPLSAWNENGIRTTDYAVTNQKQEATGGTITNRQVADLKDTSTSKLYLRRDTSVSDARKGPGDAGYYPPSYDYNCQDCAPKINSYGAYYNPANNRIEYKTDSEGHNVHMERAWQTDY